MKKKARNSNPKKTHPSPAPDSFSRMQRRIGSHIRLVRLHHGLSQQQLAKKAGLHPGHLGQVERGEVNFGMGTLIHIVRALDMKVAKFLKGIA
jgi:transcriptional regulator with XRE-family HTH domain